MAAKTQRSCDLLASPTITVTVSNGDPLPTPTATPSATLTSTPTATATTAIVAITSPANGGTVSGTVTINVAAEEPPVSWVNLLIDGNYIASSPPLTFSWNSTTGADGSHTITAQGKNSSGTVVGTSSITVTVSN